MWEAESDVGFGMEGPTTDDVRPNLRLRLPHLFCVSRHSCSAIASSLYQPTIQIGFLFPSVHVFLFYHDGHDERYEAWVGYRRQSGMESSRISMTVSKRERLIPSLLSFSDICFDMDLVRRNGSAGWVI